MVFILLALAPLVPTILINYSLEMCEAEDHPRYVSLVNLAMMPPFLLSPLVGGLVQAIGFRQVALASAVLMFLGTALTFWLDEPRHRLRGPAKPVRDLLADE
jgi:MFS family permease